MAPDAPEPPHLPHKHTSSLPRWLEWTTAISALVISVCSIGIALYNANIESKLLKANSYPYLVSGVTDATLEGRDRIVIDLINNGVGPGDERSLKIKVGDRYVTDVDDLIRTALAPEDATEARKLLKNVHDNEPTRFVASKDRGLVFQIDKTPENAAYWDKLDRSITTKGWKLEYCYCSVFEECWAVADKARTAVKACVRDEPHEFTPRGHYEQPDAPAA
jgi:hypothetical protein